MMNSNLVKKVWDVKVKVLDVIQEHSIVVFPVYPILKVWFV